jgi:hypothetical protein
MSADEALMTARAAGIHLGIDGDDLVLEADAPPPPAVIDLLSRHKAEIVSLLRLGNDGSSAEDRQVLFDERVAIAEFDSRGGARRGQVDERPDGLFLHFCEECGAWGAFGYGVSLRTGKLGRWYCAAHRPRAGVGSSMGLGLEQPDVDRTDL